MSETAAHQVVERFLAALNDSDTDAMMALLSEDVAFDTREGEREIGKEKFDWHLGLSTRHFRERYDDIAVMVAPGGIRAAAEFTVSGTYLATKEGFPEASGQTYRIAGGMFFEIDDGLITRLTTYLNMSAWRAALGRPAS